MILAAIDGDWVVPLVVVIFGFLNWLSGKVKPKEKKRQSFPKPTTTAQPRSPGNEEEERMRKFLEALGLPADAAPEAPRPAQRQPPPMRREREARKARRQTIPEPVSAPPPLPAEPSLDEDSAPVLSLEKITMPTLVVPTVAEFATVSSSIGAIPRERSAAPVVTADRPTAGERLRQELATKSSLRSAFLLREILGPPRSLQS